MMKRKNILCFVLSLLLLVSLTGCMGMDTKISVKEDGSGTMSVCLMVDTELNKYLQESSEEKQDFSNYKVSRTIYDDNLYICYEIEQDFSDTVQLEKMMTETDFFADLFPEDSSETNEYIGLTGTEGGESQSFGGAQVTNHDFQAVIEGNGIPEEDSFINDAIFTLVSISFDEPIVYTNGTLSEDKKTASWKIGSESTDTLLQASTVSKDSFKADTNAPVISGIKDMKYYNQPVSYFVSDDLGLEFIKCNGEIIGKEEYAFADGVYNIVAKDFYGNTTTKVFYVDQTKPSVSGVTNGKMYKTKRTIKFTDTLGIKSATLNGTKIKSGKVVSKKGSYILKVTDKAGNVQTVKFKIKK